MSQISVDDILNMSTQDIKPPPPMPRGYYRALIGDIKSGVSHEKKTRFVQYPLTLSEAGEDVDQDALAEIDDWVGRNINSDKFWITAAATYRLTAFLKAAGVSDGQLREDMQQAPGREVFVFVETIPSYKDPDVLINVASGDYLPVE